MSRTDLVTAAREATEARFDVLIACAFNFDAHASELDQARAAADPEGAHEPRPAHGGRPQEHRRAATCSSCSASRISSIERARRAADPGAHRIIGVDVFDPQTGDIRSGDTKSIAAWFIDTDYNEESFFVRHAYFLGAQDPYKSLKTALQAEIDEEAWATLYRDTRRPFPRPATGRIAVKVINHFGDEVMKVFTV